MRIIIALIVSLSLVSCSYRPILDENYKYNETPKEQSQKDVDECMKKGDEYLKQYKMRRAGKEAVRQGVIGSVFGAIIGVLTGNGAKSLARGAAIGAGVGAGLGGASVAAEGKVTPDQIKQRYVSNCLARQGYSVIGWE